LFLRGAFFIVASLSVIAFQTSRDRAVRPWPLLFLLIFILWAVSGSVLSGSLSVISADLPQNILLLILGVAIFSLSREGVVSDRVGYWLLFYFISTFAVTVWLGGFRFGWPPGFNFERATNLDGAEVSYSLGVSNFYALASLTALHLATSSASRAKSACLMMASVAFMLVTFLGGARGESAVAVLIFFCLLVSRKPYLAVAILSSLVAWALWLGDVVALMDGFVLVQRLSEVTGGYYGARDQLLLESFALLKSAPGCLVFGCGAGFFQYFYGYPSSLYPHNIFVEWAIVFGAVSAVVVVAIVVRGVAIYARRVGRIDLFILLFAYSFLVNQKSGSLLDSWLTVSGVTVFMTAGLFPRYSVVWARSI
jgi:hypothetical protein